MHQSTLLQVSNGIVTLTGHRDGHAGDASARCRNTSTPPHGYIFHKWRADRPPQMPRRLGSRAPLVAAAEGPQHRAPPPRLMPNPRPRRRLQLEELVNLPHLYLRCLEQVSFHAPHPRLSF